MATGGNRRRGSDDGYRDFTPSNYRGRHGSGSGLYTTRRASEFSSKDQGREEIRPRFDNKRKFSPVGPDGREKRRIESRPREKEPEEGELVEAGFGLIEEPASVVRDGIDRIRGCRSGNEYEYLHEISEGTYGKVSKGRDKKTGEEVALKKVKMDGGSGNLREYGFPITALREINILMSLRHPSIVEVKEMGVGKALDSFYMVMEHLDHDLRGLTQAMRQPFSTCEVKCLMLQLLQGVKYIHDSFVLHRDLKTSNLLYKDGRLKICDFGMSRRYRLPVRPYTSGLVTLWYRAPELLLGAKTYSTAVDMWSVGCIMAELLAKEPLFPGKYEIHQLGLIFQTLGTPNETKWPGFSNLPGAKGKFGQQSFNLLRKKFPKVSFTGYPALSDKGFDLLNKLLTLDPRKRITADAALCHSWFQEFPLPKTIDMMPSFPHQYGKNR